MSTCLPSVAVIGAGYWGSNLIRNFADLGVLKAVVDEDADRAAALAASVGVQSRPLGEVLADEQIAAVAIATPAATHASLATRALRAGKHCFVEKPLALDVEDAVEVVRVAQEVGRVLMVGHLLRYHPAFQELHRLVVSGELGRLQYVSSNRLSFGRFRREENSLWSFAPHDISMILALVGEEPDEIAAIGSRHLHATIEDVTTTHMSFPGGQGAHVHVSWLHPVKHQELVAIGERGMAIFNDGNPWTSKLRLFRHNVEWRFGQPVPAKAEGENVPLAPAEPLRAECAHFIECVSQGISALTDGDEALRVLRVLQRAQQDLQPAETVTRRTEHVGVHSTATIDDGVSLGANVRIWHQAHILTGSKIGDGSSLGQNVMVGPNVSIGDGCKIQNNVSVYEGVTLESGVFCGPSMVFTNVRTPRAGWDRRGEFEQTLVREGASIGANATIVCGVVLGRYCLIAAGAIVTRDVPAHALMVGAPAQQVGWVSHAGERLEDDLVCPRTGDRYIVTEGRLERHE